MEALVVARPVVLDRSALEQEEGSGSEESEDVTDQVDSPEDAQPSLVDDEDAAIEEEQRQFNGEEGGPVGDRVDPLVLPHKARLDVNAAVEWFLHGLTLNRVTSSAKT